MGMIFLLAKMGKKKLNAQVAGLSKHYLSGLKCRDLG
jgi:hypothetical protein